MIRSKIYGVADRDYWGKTGRGAIGRGHPGRILFRQAELRVGIVDHGDCGLDGAYPRLSRKVIGGRFRQAEKRAIFAFRLGFANSLTTHQIANRSISPSMT
jgi:hypothetical protein